MNFILKFGHINIAEYINHINHIQLFLLPLYLLLLVLLVYENPNKFISNPSFLQKLIKSFLVIFYAPPSKYTYIKGLLYIVLINLHLSKT